MKSIFTDYHYGPIIWLALMCVLVVVGFSVSWLITAYLWGLEGLAIVFHYHPWMGG